MASFHNSAINVEHILRKLDIIYEKEKTFDDLKFKNKLRFDFYLPKLQTLIEFQGRQHYQYIEYFHKTEQEFTNQQLKDQLKRTYCNENNYTLIEIPYYFTDDEIMTHLVKSLNQELSQDVLLPKIDEFIELNRDYQINMNAYYDEYLRMIKQLRYKQKPDYEIFKLYVIDYDNLIYDGIKKEDNDYYESYINKNYDYTQIVDPYEYYINNAIDFLENHTTFFKQEYIPKSVIYNILLDINQLSEDDFSHKMFTNLMKPNMLKYGYEYTMHRIITRDYIKCIDVDYLSQLPRTVKDLNDNKRSYIYKKVK